MPLFSDPEERPSPREAGIALLRSSGLLLGLFGWACIAISLSDGVYFSLAGIGLLASVFSKRAFILSLIVEIVMLSAAATLVPVARNDWFLTGAACFVLARAVWLTLRYRARKT